MAAALPDSPLGAHQGRLAGIPKFLETRKDDTLVSDRKNLAVLRRLAL